MRTVTVLLLLCVVLLVAGCIPSLHRFYEEKDIAFDPALVGTWAAEGDGDTWAFSQSGEKAYDLVYTCDAAPGSFVAVLFKLENSLFLDLYPKLPEAENENCLYRMHVIPGHTVMRVWLDGDKLRLAYMDSDRVEQIIKQKKASIATEGIEGHGPIFTAQTPELRRFLFKHAGDEKLFPEPSEYHRRK